MHVCKYFSSELHQNLSMVLMHLVIRCQNTANWRQYTKHGIDYGGSICLEQHGGREGSGQWTHNVCGSQKSHLLLGHQGVPAWKQANLKNVHLPNPTRGIYMSLFITQDMLAIWLNTMVLKATSTWIWMTILKKKEFASDPAPCSCSWEESQGSGQKRVGASSTA